MTVRYVRGNSYMKDVYTVATAQAVERGDFVALQSDTIVRASDMTWGTAVATPLAPTVADGGTAVGTPLTNSATGVKVSIQFPWGEGALSNAGSATPTANAFLKVTLAALPAPGLWWNIYVETSAGSGTYKHWGNSASASIVFVDSYGAGRTPPTAVLSAETQITQYNFAQLFAGVSNQRKVANVARIFGNSEDNNIMVCHGGIWEISCSSANFDAGDWVGPAKDTGDDLMDQTVVEVAHPSLAIGRVVKSADSATKIMVEIMSSLNPVVPTLVDLAGTSPA